MKVSLTNGKLLDIRFNHDVRARKTVCNVLDVTGLQESTFPKVSSIIAVGVAKAHPNDQFSKRAGRRYSLTYALEDAKLDRESRKRAWEAYHKFVKDQDAIAAGKF